MRKKRGRRKANFRKAEHSDRFKIKPEELVLALRFMVGWINADRKPKTPFGPHLIRACKQILNVQTDKEGHWYLRRKYGLRLDNCGIRHSKKGGWFIENPERFARAWAQLLETGAYDNGAQQRDNVLGRKPPVIEPITYGGRRPGKRIMGAQKQKSELINEPASQIPVKIQREDILDHLFG